MTSMQVPRFENDASASLLVLAATVIAEGARAGDTPHASALLLPAATATLTPSPVSRVMALSSAVLAPPPRLRLATAGRPGLVVAHDPVDAGDDARGGCRCPGS